MKWNDYDEKLRKLWNDIATSYSETVSSTTSLKSENKAFALMEEITNLLKDK